MGPGSTNKTLEKANGGKFDPEFLLLFHNLYGEFRGLPVVIPNFKLSEQVSNALKEYDNYEELKKRLGDAI